MGLNWMLSLLIDTLSYVEVLGLLCDSEEHWLLCAVTAVFVRHLRQQALLFHVDTRYEQVDLVVNKDNNDLKNWQSCVCL